MIKVLNVKSLYSALYQTIEFCKRLDGEEIEIIVPDKLSLFMEKFLFEHMNMSASFNIKVATLNRFAKKNCFVDKEKQISKVGSIILINKILNENIDNLQVLKSKAYSFSYAEDIFKTIGQLKASKISFEEMKQFSSNDVQLAGKIQDLALVYEQYEIGKAGLLDASDMFLMSTLSVAEGRENANLLFVGFDDFTAIEYAIIERLATVAKVNIFNYQSNNTNKYIYNSEMISQLRNIAYINELPFEIEVCKNTKTGLKKFLEDNLYSLNKESFVLNKEIAKVFAGNSINDEIEFVARDIRHKILNGQRCDDFGVAVFGLDSNKNKIKEIFEKYEINYYIDSEFALTKSILYKFIVSVLKYNIEGYSLSHLIEIINSPFFELENEKKREIIQRLIAVKFRGKIQQINSFDFDDKTKLQLTNFVSKFTFEKDIKVCELVDKFKTLADGFDDVLNEIANQDVEAKLLLLKSKDVLFNLFDDILKFYNSMSIKELYDVFVRVSSVVKINNLPLKLDAVKVVDANNTMEIFKDLYMISVTQENAPNLKYDCGIILDNEIEKLNFAFKLSPSIAHINKLSRLRLYNSIMMFENELNVTYSNSQSDIIKELLEMLQIETSVGVVDVEPISNFGYEKYVALSQWDYLSFLCKNDKNNQKINEKLLNNNDFSNISQKNLNIYNDFNVVSPTTLENYFKCPMMAFLSNILKIKPRLNVEILSLDIGNVLHDIMYKFYKRKKQVGDLYEFCKTEVFKCVERDERLKLNADSPILINLIDEAVRVLNAVNYIDENSNFEPKFFEQEFKNENVLKLKNISIAGKVDRVDVCNDMFRIVDYKSGRADASLKELYYGNKLQLFLYSCAMENVLKKHAVGAFYLPLHNAYTKELSNTYSLKGFYLAEDFVVKAFDRRLQAGTKSDIVNISITKADKVRKTIGYKELSSTELEELKSYAKRVSENAVDEIMSGYVAPSPSEVSKPCEFCPYIHVCMKESCNVVYRKTDKINLDSFKEANND